MDATSGWKGIWNFLQARNVCKIIGNPYFALCVCVYWFIQTSDQSLTFIVYFCGGVTCVPPWMVGVIANLILIQKSLPFANKAMRVECIFSGRRRRVVQVIYYCNCSGIGIISSCIVSPLSRTNDHWWEVFVTDHQSSKWRWWWCCWVSRRNVQSNAIVAFVYGWHVHIVLLMLQLNNYACVYYMFGQLITDPNANAQLISTFIVVIHPIIIYCTQSDIFYYLFAFLGHTQHVGCKLN